MTSKTILLIDDELTLLELVSDHLKMAGYEALTARYSATGLRLATEATPDLIVLDVMMPDMDGWEICRLIRERSSVPIIMLTAKGEELDKLRGFRLGVDDYVTKPFSIAELVARVGAVLTRVKHGAESVRQITSGELMVDLSQHRVSRNDRVIDLTPTEFRLLEILVLHANRPVSTETLLHQIWGDAYAAETDYVKHYIWALRTKIENDPGDPRHILTERGYGYRFE